MILIEIDNVYETYTIHDTTCDNEWEYNGVYKGHHIDSNGMLHIEFTSGKVEILVGCCVLNIKNEEE